MRQANAIREQLAEQSAHIDAQGEVLDLVLRRLRKTEENTNALSAPIQLLRDEVAELSQPLPDELSPRTVGVLNQARSHMGWPARFGLWVNEPVAIEYTPEEVRWVLTVERIAEIPFALQALAGLQPPARILDVGACESLIPLELASLGYRVTAIDIRPYAYSHPNLTSVKASILDWEGDGQQYDGALILSTLEHLGLPVYGETVLDENADVTAMARIKSLMRPGGLLVFTSPFGRSRTESTQRIYSAADLTRLMEGFRIETCAVARRRDAKTWMVQGRLSFSDLPSTDDCDQCEAAIMITATRE